MKPLSSNDISQLERQGCTSASWASVTIDPACDLGRFRNAEFVGTVSVGQNTGEVEVDGGPRPCGIYNATVIDTAVGEDVRISGIGSAISRYVIGDGVVVEDVSTLLADEGATFGAGTEVETVNEAGGRHVVLFPEMSAQTSFLQAFRLHDDSMQKKLSALVKGTIEAGTPKQGVIRAGAKVLHCGIIRNVCIGESARIEGVAHLEDGTILSCPEHPTAVGAGVQAHHFVIAEGAKVDGGVLLDKVYVGQASKIGKQYSAENCLFFANCEGFHGESVAIFAGPYTVTHHKSTLLIAAQFSFYNAGSGTNQSNHMYKLGPVHQGVFERGCKTGSFSYVLHETHVGAFSVIIGKHYVNINAGDLPFSNIHEVEGQSRIVPGMNLFTVGTVRDGEKWPKRDGRKGPVKRDLITFDVYSPYTVEKMRRGRDVLRNLQETTPKDQNAVKVGGLTMKRFFLRKSAKFYQQAITCYLSGKVFDRLDEALKGGTAWKDATASLKYRGTLKQPAEWVDVSGLLMPREGLRAIEAGIAKGAFSSMRDVQEAFHREAERYRDAEWEYVCKAFEDEQGFAPHAMTKEQAAEVLEDYADAIGSMQGMILDDSKKEYDSFARIGYGIGMEEEEMMKDFEAVRGTVEKNSVVSKLAKQKAETEAWIETLRGAIAVAT